jgi:DNA-binding Lrp family transcriptional regulator
VAEKKSSMPNIMVWSWMSALDVSGVELLIFAFIFGTSFDSVHRCYTSLNEMEQWFGLTRQAVSRRIQSLVDKGYIMKYVSTQSSQSFIKHNSYAVNMQTITDICSKCDDSVYTNFMTSYGNILKQKFPQDSSKIDDYIQKMCDWHHAKDVQVCLTIKQLSDLMLAQDNIDMVEALGIIDRVKDPKKASKKDFIEKTVKKQNTLFDSPKPKSRRAKKNEWDVEKQTMTTDFVYMRLKGNEEIHEAIKQFLSTDAGRNYTPDQWHQQLENLYDYGITPERMLSGIKMSYMNGYRSLYLVDKSEVDMRKKMKLIDEYVLSECDDNEELREVLLNYIFEVPKGKSFSEKQFKLALDNLSDICKTTEEKLASVKNSYAHSYSSLAYRTSNYESDTEVDMEEKHNAVDKFIETGYYYMVDGLADALHSYVNTKNARSMDINTFNLVLSNFRLFCLSDDDKLSKVLLAIQNNYKYLATEDYEETKKLKAKLETRQTMADSLDHARRSRVIAQKLKTPNDPRLKNVEARKRSNNVI